MKEQIQVDELIIGAGLSGLMYGLVALEDNYKVAITESHYKAGGYATCFMREKKKYIFDCSQHKITGLGEEGNLRNAFERAGIMDLLDFHFYEELTTIVYKGNFTKVPTTSEEIKRMLIGKFPKEENGINKLFEDIETYGYQHYMFGRMMLGEFVINKDLLPESRYLSGITAKQYFRILFKDKDLVEFLSAIAIYLGTLANESNAFYFLHFLYTTFYTRQAHLKGTGYNLSAILAEEFKRRGGLLILNNPAQKINLSSNSNVSSVETVKREFITDRIMGACAPSILLDLVGKENIPNTFLSKMEALKPGWGHFCVYLVCACPPSDLGLNCSEYLLVADAGDDFDLEDLEEEKYYDKLTLSVTNYHKIYEEGGYVLQLILLDYEANWFTLGKDEYASKKKRIQEKLIKRACQYFPKLKDQIKYAESSTPRTNFKYTASQHGSSFGYKVMPKTNLGFLNQFPVKGIKLASGWTVGPGYEAALCIGFTHAMLQKNSMELNQKNIH
jgi:all-trans-retinol 13,14-reductase